MITSSFMMQNRGRVLVVASQKGGVGKTTIALNLAYALAHRGWRTLLVDADPQGSIGCSIRGDLRHQPGLADVLRGAPLEKVVVSTRQSQLQLLPIGRLPVLEAAGWSADLRDGKTLGGFLDAGRQSWDVLLLDTPPGMGGVTLGALRQADDVLVPLQAEPLAARSLPQILEAIASLRERGSGPNLAGLVLNMLQSRNDDSLAVAQESWRLLAGTLNRHSVLDTIVPRDNVFLEASAEGVPVALLRRRPPAVAAVFDQLAAEIEERIHLEVPDDERKSLSLLD